MKKLRAGGEPKISVDHAEVLAVLPTPLPIAV
jgi:hypothetical protein